MRYAFHFTKQQAVPSSVLGFETIWRCSESRAFEISHSTRARNARKIDSLKGKERRQSNVAQSTTGNFCNITLSVSYDVSPNDTHARASHQVDKQQFWNTSTENKAYPSQDRPCKIHKKTRSSFSTSICFCKISVMFPRSTGPILCMGLLKREQIIR